MDSLRVLVNSLMLYPCYFLEICANCQLAAGGSLMYSSFGGGLTTELWVCCPSLICLSICAWVMLTVKLWLAVSSSQRNRPLIVRLSVVVAGCNLASELVFVGTWWHHRVVLIGMSKHNMASLKSRKRSVIISSTMAPAKIEPTGLAQTWITNAVRNKPT